MLRLHHWLHSVIIHIELPSKPKLLVSLGWKCHVCLSLVSLKSWCLPGFVFFPLKRHVPCALWCARFKLCGNRTHPAQAGTASVGIWHLRFRIVSTHADTSPRCLDSSLVNAPACVRVCGFEWFVKLECFCLEDCFCQSDKDHLWNLQLNCAQAHRRTLTQSC